jgi:DNA repair protein RadC
MASNEEKNALPHKGHRQRMKKRFLTHGLENFDDHNVLELLLFYALPQGDINPTAHALINKFGKLSAVFDAPLEELMQVSGVGESAATLIKLLPQVSRRYQISRSISEEDIYLTDSKKAGRFIVPYFYGECEEAVYMVCMDAKCKVISCKLLFKGEVNSANVSVRKIVENALANKATNIILAHNHPSGVALPSKEDEVTTERIAEALKAVDITLADHIVVAEDDFVSMSDNGFFRK